MPNDSTYPQDRLQRHQDGSAYVPAGAPIDFALGALKIAGTDVSTPLSRVAAAAGGAAFDRVRKCAKVALAAVDTGGGIFSWLNPEAGAIIIERVIVDVTTVATGACSIDVGSTAASGTTQADNLIDGLDVHTAAGVFDQADQAGANGKTKAKLAQGGWVTGSKDTGASAGLVGSAYIEYVLA
jgi:hypothetical protein